MAHLVFLGCKVMFIMAVMAIIKWYPMIYINANFI